MGTPNGEPGDADEKPQHDIQLGAFNIERYEVSNAQYRACVAAGACPPGGGPSNNFPAVNVTWYGADAYCRWIGRRLPNEAEWERAGRGADNWRYSFSNAAQGGMHFEWNAIYHGSPLSYCEASCPLQHYDNDVNDGYAYAAPVDVSFADISKGFGVENMNGNVSEWTSNWFDPNAYTQGYNMSVYGPSNSTGAKVVRGGSWATQLLRLADRNSLAPNASRNDLGFRCAQ
jgi:iron(II)-dependent oxidoreductase